MWPNECPQLLPARIACAEAAYLYPMLTDPLLHLFVFAKRIIFIRNLKQNF
jgi:hypothetical protein